MSKPLKIMFTPEEMVGHITSGLGLAHVLRARGHHVVFVLRRPQREVVEKYGFDVEVIDNPLFRDTKCGELESTRVVDLQLAEEKTVLWFVKQSLNWFSYTKLAVELIFNYFYRDYKFKQIIDRYKPDILIADSDLCYPSIIYSGRPWVWFHSPNPLLVFGDKNLPPPFSGYNSNAKGLLVRAGHLLSDQVHSMLKNMYKSAFLMRGYPPNPENRSDPNSPYLNIYGYPLELDYTNKTMKYRNTIRIDMFCTPDMDKDSELSAGLMSFIDTNRDKKLIFVSLGSCLSANVKIMKKLVQMLSRSPHSFIIAKGHNEHRYELGHNMWGERYVPQRRLLPLVDAVITHGGSNSMIEAFTYGKPHIVLPIISDGIDNAQRIHELGFGLKLDVHRLEEQTLLSAIESALNDQQMRQRLTAASKRMLGSDSLEKAADVIEKLQSFS